MLDQNASRILRMHASHLCQQFNSEDEYLLLFQYFRCPNKIYTPEAKNCHVASKLEQFIANHSIPQQIEQPNTQTHQPSKQDFVAVPTPNRLLKYHTHYLKTSEFICTRCQRRIKAFKRPSLNCNKKMFCHQVVNSLDMYNLYNNFHKDEKLTKFSQFIVKTQSVFVYKALHKTIVQDYNENSLLLLPSTLELEPEIRKTYIGLLKRDIFRPLLVLGELLKPGHLQLHANGVQAGKSFNGLATPLLTTTLATGGKPKLKQQLDTCLGLINECLDMNMNNVNLKDEIMEQLTLVRIENLIKFDDKSGKFSNYKQFINLIKFTVAPIVFKACFRNNFQLTPLPCPSSPAVERSCYYMCLHVQCKILSKCYVRKNSRQKTHYPHQQKVGLPTTVTTALTTNKSAFQVLLDKYVAIFNSMEESFTSKIPSASSTKKKGSSGHGSSTYKLKGNDKGLVCELMEAGETCPFEKMSWMGEEMINAIYPMLMLIFYDLTSVIYDVRNYQGNTKKQLLQGRKSAMRKTVLAPSIPSVRAQVLIRPELRTDEIIFPITEKFQFEFLFEGKAVRMFDVRRETFQSDVFYTLPISKAIIAKRDPVLKTVLGFTRIAFANTTSFWVSSTIAESINLDQDGDTLTTILLRNVHESVEFRCAYDPTVDIFCGVNSSKYSLIESIILIWHRCRFSPNVRLVNFPRVNVARLYEEYVQVYMSFWINNEMNQKALNELEKIWIEANNEPLGAANIEVTKGIFDGFIKFIAKMYGHFEANELINLVNHECCRLSYYNCSNVLDTRGKNIHYSYDVVKEPNLANHVFRDIVISGARATIGHLVDGLKMVKFANDLTGPLAYRIDQPCKRAASGLEVIRKTTAHGRSMAESSRSVPALGHKSFKSAIQYQSIRFTDNHLHIFNIDFGAWLHVDPFLLFDCTSVAMILKSSNLK